MEIVGAFRILVSNISLKHLVLFAFWSILVGEYIDWELGLASSFFVTCLKKKIASFAEKIQLADTNERTFNT